MYTFQEYTLDDISTQGTLTSSLKKRVDISKYSTTTLLGAEKINDEVAHDLPDDSWSATSDQILYRKNGPDTAIGLPEYLNFYTYDLISKNNELVKEKAGIDMEAMTWDLLEQDEEVVVPTEFEIYADNDQFIISHDQEYAAWIEVNTDGELIVYLLESGDSEDQKIELGSVRYGVESSHPDLKFTANDEYLISEGGQEVFSVVTNKTIVSEPADYTRNIISFSPDYTKLLLIQNVQDRVDEADYDHETVEIKVIDLKTFEQTSIFSAQGDMSEAAYLVALEATWAPDSEYLIYNYNKHLWLTDITGEATKQLTKTAQTYQEPRWSPDGKYLAYRVDQDLYLVAVEVKNLFSKKVKKQLSNKAEPVNHAVSESTILNPRLHTQLLKPTLVPARR